MKSISSTTGLEVYVEPFITDLVSLCETASTGPISDFSQVEAWSEYAPCSEHDFFSATSGESLLDFLFSPTYPSLTLFETLVRDESPASRAAILYYLPLSPVVRRDISALIPSLLGDPEIVVSLATNIGYYHAHNFISDGELEYLFMHILTCGDGPGKIYQNLDARLLHLYHLTKRQVDQYHDIVVPSQKLWEEGNHQRMLKKTKRNREKNWQRKRAAAHRTLSEDSHVQPGVPLPYGCSTNADVFTDVNEMYTLLDPPGLDWAQSRTSSYHSLGLGEQPPRVVLPDKA